MIDGLRQHPWLQLAAHRDRATVSLLLDCEMCKRIPNVERRQNMGCPYEEPPIMKGPGGWRHPGYDGPAPEVCPGYTTKLPAVRERTWHLHWLKAGGFGALVAELGREPTTEDMAELRVLESNTVASESWAMKHPPDKEQP